MQDVNPQGLRRSHETTMLLARIDAIDRQLALLKKAVDGVVESLIQFTEHR